MSLFVDTSVWIDYLNASWTGQARLLDSLIGVEEIVVGDIVLCEVLQGLRTEASAAQVERVLRRFAVVSVLTPDLAVKSAANYRRLRSQGVTIRSTIDVMIATYCMECGLPLLHDDRDFESMAARLGLQTVRA